MTLEVAAQKLVLTKSHHSVMDSLVAINAASSKKACALSYFPSDYICALPQSRIDALTFSQTRGSRKITIKADDDIGFLPHSGIGRLIIAKIGQFIKITGSRALELPSITQFCKHLQIPPTGKNIHMVKLQTLALFGSHFLIKETTDNQVQAAHFTFVDDYDVNGIRLKNNKTVNDTRVDTKENKDPLFTRPRTEIEIDWRVNITISETFFNHITKHAFQVDYRALRSLIRSPMAMDIYLWLVYRMNAISRDIMMTWENLRQQFGQGFSKDKFGRQNFKKAFMHALPLAHTHYPEANITVIEKGVLLKRSPKNVVS